MKHAISHIHFVGVGGAGMSALAEIHHRLGYRVTGSDRDAGAGTARLKAIGVEVQIGHHAQHIRGAQVVVVSTAVPVDNPEVAAARAAGVPVVPRAMLLAELMRPRQGIAVAGTHGKTTTTSLVASVLQAAGVDPSYVIGGELLAVAANAGLGSGEHIVVEADESDASFLHLSPVLAVVTNIDADHMETYGHSVDRLRGAFVDFVHRLPFYGRAVVCADDAGIAAVLPRLQRPVTTYGLGEGAELRAVDVQALPGAQMRFVARQSGRADLPLLLNLAGEHNVRNALAALAIARELGLPDAEAAQAFASFAGVGRRFQRHGELPAQGGGRYALVDDYGHHPAELAAVIAAARGAWPGRRLVVAFQPHRYTRTRDCMADFATVLRQCDAVLLCDVYAAGEPPIEGADAAALARQVPGADYVGGVDALASAIGRTARDGDVVVTLGAGTIAAVAPGLATRQQQGGCTVTSAAAMTRAATRTAATPAAATPTAATPTGATQTAATLAAATPAAPMPTAATPTGATPAGATTTAKPADIAALGKVAVLTGGSSAEREVSLMSGTGVLAALRALGVDAHAFDPAERDLVELKREGYARAFIALHGRHGEDGTVQGALELLGIPYTGSGVMASALAMDKVMTKRVWAAAGLPTPRWLWLAPEHQRHADVIAVPDTLGLPLIVKPPREGSSIGITKVAGYSQMQDAVALAARYDADVLCEEFIEGIELTCPVLGSGADARALPVVRIDAPGGNYDFEHKYFSDETGYRCPSGLDPDEEAEVQRLTLAAYRTLGCRGWGRADLMLRAGGKEKDRRIFLLEMNTSPGMTGHSLVPMSARAAGIGYEQLCLALLRDASLDSAR